MGQRDKKVDNVLLVMMAVLIIGAIGLIMLLGQPNAFNPSDQHPYPIAVVNTPTDGKPATQTITQSTTTYTPVATGSPIVPTVTLLTPALTVMSTKTSMTIVPPRGNIYFVSLSGSDANPGTQQQPWRSIRKAAGVAVAGDTIIVREGTYQELIEFHTSGIERMGVTDVNLTSGDKVSFPDTWQDIQPGDSVYIYNSRNGNNGVFPIIEVESGYVRVSGAPFIDETQLVQASIATPITFRVFQGEKVTLDLKFEDNRGSPARFIGASYIILDGFRVTRSLHAGISFDRSHHNVFQNGEIFNNGRPGVYVINGSIYNMIIGSSIHDNGVFGPGEGVYIGKSPQDGGPDSAHATHVIGNHIYNITEDEGTDVKPGIEGTVIANNVYENCASTWGVVIIGDQSSKSLVYGNVLRDNSGSESWAGAITIHGPDNLIYNNLITNNSGLDGIYLFRFPDNKVYHNTIYGHDVGIGLDKSGPDISGTDIANNLLSHNQSQIDGDLGNAVLDCNLIDGESLLLGTNAIRSVPLFVNPWAGDFRLAAGSPAIDTCSDRGVQLDRNRLPRLIGGRCDIGAYEYSGR
ncbi:MAG: right-handed parallel beta-helix repeat-containing protein [Anaerolineae bacterium]|nr:right-handed parallel beta-helix repeat-containing protein [Anaerolineae bacterium]